LNRRPSPLPSQPRFDRREPDETPLAAKTTLNAANLETLGTERLAALVLEQIGRAHV